MIIMPGADRKTACERAQQIRDSVMRLSVAQNGRMFDSITVSGGVAHLPTHGRAWKEVVRAADAALYCAKRGGRNRVVAASQDSSSVG